MNTTEKLIDFIVNKYLGFPPKNEITGNTRVREDLEIEGDDAIDFFEKIEIEFNVNFKDLDLSKYFYSEGFNFFSFILNFINKSKKSIKINDIGKSIAAGKWLEPE